MLRTADLIAFSKDSFYQSYLANFSEFLESRLCKSISLQTLLHQCGEEEQKRTKMWPRKLVHHLKGNDQQKANHVASSLVTSSSTPQYIDSQLVDLKVKCARVTWRGVMLLMILRMSMFCYSVLQYNTRLKIITIIVFTVTR